MMLGSSLAGAQLTMICGSERRSVVGAVNLGPQADDLVAGSGCLLGGARARAHQHDRGDDREAEDAERQRQRGDLMRVESRKRAEIDVDERG